MPQVWSWNSAKSGVADGRRLRRYLPARRLWRSSCPLRRSQSTATGGRDAPWLDQCGRQKGRAASVPEERRGLNPDKILESKRCSPLWVSCLGPQKPRGNESLLSVDSRDRQITNPAGNTSFASISYGRRDVKGGRLLISSRRLARRLVAGAGNRVISRGSWEVACPGHFSPMCPRTPECPRCRPNPGPAEWAVRTRK